MKTIFVTLGLSLAMAAHATADTLTLQVKTASDAGTVRAALYGSQQDFDSENFTAFAFAPAEAGLMQLKIQDLQPGTYGIALFQDLNGNEILDSNLFGAPIEPFGFSENPKIGFSAPEFDDFKFEFDGTPMQLEITLNGS